MKAVSYAPSLASKVLPPRKGPSIWIGSQSKIGKLIIRMKRIYVALRMSKNTSAAFGGKYKIQYRVHFQVAYYVLWCRGIVKAAWYCSSFSSPQLALISAKKTSKSRKENKSGFMRTPRLWTFELQ